MSNSLVPAFPQYATLVPHGALVLELTVGTYHNRFAHNTPCILVRYMIDVVCSGQRGIRPPFTATPCSHETHSELRIDRKK